jgi:Fe-S cluster assembly scaffold protein SufB
MSATRAAGKPAGKPAGKTAKPAAKPAAPVRQAPLRQGPADLTLGFADEATVRKVSAAASEPDWLLADRLEGLRAFEALPIETNPLYTTYIDLRNAHLAGARPNLDPETLPDGEGRDPKLLPEGAAGFAELRDDRVTALVLAPDASDAGVVLDTLAGLRARNPELLRSLLEGGCALPSNDKLAQLNRALWSRGLVVHVPDGVRLERPIVLRWAAGTPGTALLSRTILSIGENAEASIVEEQVSSTDPSLATTAAVSGAAAADAQAFFAGTTEVRLGAGSTLAFAGLQDFSLGQIAFQHRSASVGQGATLRWALAQLGCRVIRSRIDNRLEGDGSTVEQAEIVFGSSDQLFDLTSYTCHLGRDTTGNLLSKAALADRSRVYMKGLITIDRPARGTDSYLGEFGMLLSKQARSVAIPSLEIDQPDCRRAAHASSVGPIDESLLFYLQSRGIEPDEARKYIVLGYLEPVVARVPLEEVRDRLRGLLEDRWATRTGGRAPEAAVA